MVVVTTSETHHCENVVTTLSDVATKIQPRPNVVTKSCASWGETRFYDSQFLRLTNAENLWSCLTDSINYLDSDKLLQLAMGAPNVNWLVLRMLDDKLG